MNKKCIFNIISVLLCFVVLFGYSQICATAITQPNATGDTVTVNFLFAFFRSEPNLSFGTIKGIFWHGREVKVLGYSGNFVHVQDSDSKNEGYIHELLLNDKPLNIRQLYVNVYKGATKDGVVTINYDKSGALEWSVSPTGIVEVTEYSDCSLSIKGLSSGTATLTVKCNGDKDTCDVACIEKWSDTETAKAESNITVMGTPGKTYKPEKIISADATITALGNIPDQPDYVYVSSGNIWGFIKLSDFPAIKYMMTQYHYYDKGYDLRFSSANSKISDYASVLNDVMMENFGMKVYSYVNLYTSVADECKILSDGKVKTGNISNACSGAGNHKSGTCLTTENVRNDLKRQFGNGGKSISKVAWTGHIMTNNERSNGTVGMGTIIMTPYGTVGESQAEIREDRIFTLVHETSHQLGVHDHYCRGDISPITKKCSYSHCSKCYGETIPYGCIMYERVNIEDVSYTDLYCDDCIKNITNTIKNF